MRKLATLFLILNTYFVSYGVYIENLPHQLVQPNGEVLNVFITGDEFFRRVHDIDGYSIVEREDGWFTYALYDEVNDKLIPSEYTVSSTHKPQLPMEKGLGISHAKYMEIRKAHYEPTSCEASGYRKNSILENLSKQGVKTTTQMNNIIICIGFSDTEAMTHSFPTVDAMFNTNPNNNLRDYFYEMSYGQLDIISHFYPPADGTVLSFYKDSNPRNYYRPYSASNPIGYSSSQANTRRTALLTNAVNYVNTNWSIPAGINLDVDNDGNCDYITFVVQGPTDECSDLLWPHKSSLSGSAMLGSKRVRDYNFELDGTSSVFDVATFCHEGFHVLGAPDLYHYDYYKNLNAVGGYDVMESTPPDKPQSMSAYMKWKYGKWITNMPIAVINRTYEVYPFYTHDGSDANKPVIIRVPCTSNPGQYYVVEYRKKTGCNYDNQSAVPGAGPLIYRINQSINGNSNYNPAASRYDEVYIFRPDSRPVTVGSSTSAYTQGALSLAPFIGTQTSFNKDTNPYPYSCQNTIDQQLNISDITYDSETDSYFFFYGTADKFFNIADTDPITLGYAMHNEGSIEIDANVRWKVSVFPPAAASWLDVSQTTGLNSATYHVRLLNDNNTYVDRFATLTFAGNDTQYSIDITQEPLTRWVAPSYLWFQDTGADASGNTITLSASSSWTAACNASWIDFNPKSGSGNETVTVTCTANEQEQRAAVLNFTINGNTVPVNIYQQAKQCVLSGTVNPADVGTIAGLGVYDYGSSVTVTATPAPQAEFVFDNWTENGTTVSSLSNYTFEIVDARHLTANFKVKTYNVPFNIRDAETNVAIAGATITFSDTDAVIVTNVNGSASISLPNGDYTCTVTKEGYISGTDEFTVNGRDLSNITIRLEPDFGIGENTQTEFRIYPNPVFNILTVVRKSDDKASVEICDIMGKKLYSLETVEAAKEINISELSAGIYFISVIDSQTKSTQRFIKK